MKQFAAPAMPENKTLDPFKPAQPQIPGVSPPDAMAQHSEAADPSLPAPGVMGAPSNTPEEWTDKLKVLWVGLTLAGAMAILFVLFGHRNKVEPAKGPTAQPAENITKSTPTSLTGNDASVNPKLPVGPGVVATKGELAKPWSAREFYFRDPLTQKQARAIVVRLPGGELWAFSLREPYGTCEMQYVTDLAKLQRDYDFTASHPMVADPCNKSVFDLTHYGSAPAGLVRGDVVKGAALRPPLAIEVRIQNDQVVAVRTEQ